MRNDQIRGASVEILLMKLAEGLKILIENPDLSKKISEAYKLNEVEQKALDEARITIASAAQLKADLEKQAQDYANIQERIEQEANLVNKNKDILVSIQEIKQKNDDILNATKQERLEIDSLIKKLDQKELNLKAWEDELKIVREDLNRQKDEIKSALDKSKLILGNLA